MSSFGAKRKARKITVREEEEDDDGDATSLGANSDTTQSKPQQQEQEPPPLQATFKTRKPFKQSSLRKSININDDDADESAKESGTRIKPKFDATGDDDTKDEETGGAPLRVRPQLGGRSASSSTTKMKKRASTASSRLSFGPSSEADITGDGDGNGNGNDDGEDSLMLGGEVSTPKKSSGLAHAAPENSAYKKGIISRNLPNLPNLGGLALRSSTDGDRLYSKEYLSELQNSTPNTPQNASTFDVGNDGDEMMSLDPSELEGAMVVEDGTIATAAATSHQTEILTEAQVREKKERRARFAKQTRTSRDGGDDFISLDDDDNDGNDQRQVGESYLSVLSSGNNNASKKKSESTRLVPEDEDLGEGFDAFVEDGGLSLGSKAEREARRKQRAQMAELINAAEGGSHHHHPSTTTTTTTTTVAPQEIGPADYSDDDGSEAERHAAYEAAQTRRGMDGLAAEREAQQRRLRGKEGVVPVPHRVAPLPDLSVLVGEFGEKVARRREEVARARARIAELRAEREAVGRREPEVQGLLDQAGERYRRAVMGMQGGGEGGVANGVADSNGNGDGDGNAAAERAKSLLDQMKMSGGGGGGSGPGTPLGARGLESLGTTPVRPSRVAEMEAEEL